MKKYSYLILLLLAVFTACENDGFENLDPNNEFVQFQTNNISIGEADPSATLTVLLGSGTNTNGVTVNYTVASSEMDRFIITPANGTITIPAGEFSADIVIEPIDNLLVDGSFDITITLGSSDLPLGIGGEGTQFVETVVSILDDDCPVDSQGLVGSYMVAEVFTAGGNQGLTLAGFFGENYQVDLALDPTDPTGTTFITSNSGGNVFFDEGTVIVLNSCPRTISFPAGNPQIAEFSIMALDDADNASTTFDDGSFTIQADAALGAFGPYQFILTKI